MAKAALAWSDLLEIYLNTQWQDGPDGQLNIASQSILDTLDLLEASDRAASEADIAVLVDRAQIQVGNVVPAHIGYPQLRLGVLAESWDGFLDAPERRVEEPANYFLKGDRAHSGMMPPTDVILRYKAILTFVHLLAQSALFLDARHAKLVYFGESRTEVPVRYSAADFKLVDPAAVERLAGALAGDIHRDQRLGILAEAVIALVAGQGPAGRFAYLLQNVDELNKRLNEGYKLFASSFSYSKVRGEIEKAQAEYVSRIHKTFSDIQGQLLGLPVSAIIVATQLKATAACDPAAIANTAILGGAWLFVLLLVASCWNQWLTLSTIAREIKGQRRTLDTDFSEIRGLFTKSVRRQH